MNIDSFEQRKLEVEMEKDDSNLIINNAQNISLKRQSISRSPDLSSKKKAKLDDETKLFATGVVMIHAACKSYQFSKLNTLKGSDLCQVTRELEVSFIALKSALVRNIEEVYVENSQSLDSSVENCSDVTPHDSDLYYPNNVKEEDICDNLSDLNKSNEIIENDKTFKFPVLDQIKSIKPRLSSSTSSSSVRASSSTENRYSSVSTHSEGSIDLQIREKSDSYLVADSSDNSIEKNEPTFIKTSDDDEEATSIYARWKNEKYYYSGTVKGDLFRTDVKVYFDDSSIETMKRGDILFREVLPIGTKVMVDLENAGCFVKDFVIVDHVDVSKFKKMPQKGYVVLCQTNNEKYTVTRDCVSVHKDDVRKILPFDASIDSTVTDSPNKSLSNISVENIVEGKRNIRWKRFSQFISPDITRARRCNSPSLLTVSTSPDRQRSTPQKRRNAFLNKNSQNSLSSVETDKLFTNWYFMITQENDQDGNTPGSLLKETVELKIRMNGGQIIEIPHKSLIESHLKKECQIVLIVLGKSYRTIKFMISLAVGNIPIVRIEWLEECINLLSIVAYDQFLVPRGIDDNDKEILQTLNDTDTLPLFERQIICVVTDSVATFGNQWKRVLEIAGATVTVIDTSNYCTDITGRSCHFAVIETDGVTRNCLKYLKERNIEVVNIEYVVKSLIHKRLLDRDQYRE